MTGTDRIPCPCCGNSLVGEFDVCEHCNWENDPVQRFKPDLPGGANAMSLWQAQAAYKAGKPIE